MDEARFAWRFPQVLTMTWLLVGGVSFSIHAKAADQSSTTKDPLEVINRPIFSFNLKADRYALKPVAKAYTKITPDPVEQSLARFFANLYEPITAANDLLQLKLIYFASDVGRFAINSTLGVAGLFDFATPLGLPKRREDFGQTLGYWGAGTGWYLMLPLLGPTTARDGTGKVVDWAISPNRLIDDSSVSWGLYAADIIVSRASYLDADKILDSVFDPYAFTRDGYLQRRQYMISDGQAADPGSQAAPPWEGDDDIPPPWEQE